MIDRVYMGIDTRHDHGFRVPRPDLTFETGAPNVCTACHADRDPPWAAAEIAQPQMREEAMTRAGKQYFRQSPEAAQEWFNESNLPADAWEQVTESQGGEK